MIYVTAIYGYHYLIGGFVADQMRYYLESALYLW